jgi:hypothetical protein
MLDTKKVGEVGVRRREAIKVRRRRSGKIGDLAVLEPDPEDMIHLRGLRERRTLRSLTPTPLGIDAGCKNK